MDVGCGKGRMLYYFSKYNFGKIDGLEYSHDLVCIARSNIYKLNLKCNVIEADAKSYDLLDGYNWFYSNELVEIAKSNMSKLNLDCRIYQGDAKEWNKFGDYNVFYLFNPFNGSTMEGVLDKLMESYSVSNRRITVIYFNPREDAVFLNYNFRKETIDKSLNLYIYG